MAGGMQASEMSSKKSRVNPALPVFAWTTLAYNIGVILWGAYVRATGSGAGCGNHWPLCNGEVLPRAEHVQTMIEFTHRVSSGIALLMVVGLWIAARFMLPRRHAARYAAGAATILMVNEALLGASLVLFEHVAQDKSLARVVSLSLHSANTMLLLGAIALAAFWMHRPISRKAWSWSGALPAIVTMATVLFAAATGAITALGDTLFPATSLGSAVAQDFSSASHYLLRLRIVHPLSAVVVTMFVAWALMLFLPRGGRLLKGLGVAVGVALVAQIILGLLNFALLAPVWLQMVHLFAADVLWISLVLFSAEWLNLRANATA